MNRISTQRGSSKFSNENEAEGELIKLAGLLEGEEWEAVMFYLKGLQRDVNDDVIKRIVNFSKKYNEKSVIKENVSY